MIALVWVLIALAISFWLFAVVLIHVVDPLIHLLLLAALILIVWNLLFAPREQA